MTTWSDRRHARADRPRGPGFVAMMSHPLIVSIFALLVGTWLTSLVVPKLTYSRTLREKRLEKALEILARNTEVNSRLNALETTLEIFHKDNSGAAAHLVDYREEQKVLRHTMMERYLEFDRTAWWWYRQAQAEAQILHLTSTGESAKIAELLESYEANLVASTGAVNSLWTTFLREEYKPSDRRNDDAMSAARKRLRELGTSRQGIIDALARLFAHSSADP